MLAWLLAIYPLKAVETFGWRGEGGSGVRVASCQSSNPTAWGMISWHNKGFGPGKKMIYSIHSKKLDTCKSGYTCFVDARCVQFLTKKCATDHWDFGVS